LVDRLIPPDADPGGRDAGVVDFLDRQLTLKYRRHQQAYRAALGHLDRRNFAGMSAAEQDAFLSEWEKGPDRATFNLILAHSMQGFYGSPRHGGNRAAASWRMLGVPAIPVRGRLHYALPPNRETS
jgi:gluconate 2-dehydrogenase gamma chain